MSEFVEAGGGAGILFLPRDLVGPVPMRDDGPFRDAELLSLAPDQVEQMTEQDLFDALRATRRKRAQVDAFEFRVIDRIDRLRAGSRYVPDEIALGCGSARTPRPTAWRPRPGW